MKAGASAPAFFINIPFAAKSGLRLYSVHIRQYLNTAYIDELQSTFSPVFLGSGESLFAGLDLPALGYRQAQKIQGEKALHIILTKGEIG